MNDLRPLQDVIAASLLKLAVLHVPILILLAMLLGADSTTVGTTAALMIVVPVYMKVTGRPVQALGVALAITLVGQAALLIYVFKGHPWQVEMHFYLFAILAMLAGFCDVTILITAALAIAVHHLLLNEFIPDALYQEAAHS